MSDAFVSSSFDARSTARDVIAGYDLSGRVALVTGASSGIGVETARAFLEAGAAVVLPVRSKERGDEAVAALRTTHPDGAIELGSMDLGSLASVRRFTDTFLATRSSLDILVTNAAVMATPPLTTSDGFELQLGTNHLGHFALTRALLPALLAHDGGRVVTLSSIGHRRSPVVLDDPFFERRPYDKWEAYGQSKTACALLAVALNDRYASDGLIANAVNPGGIMTGLQKHLSLDEQRAMGWFDADVVARFKNVEQGAATSVWAAVGRELDGRGGLYLEDCQQARPWSKDRPMVGVMDYALDAGVARALWALSEQLIGV